MCQRRHKHCSMCSRGRHRCSSRRRHLRCRRRLRHRCRHRRRRHHRRSCRRNRRCNRRRRRQRRSRRHRRSCRRNCRCRHRNCSRSHSRRPIRKASHSRSCSCSRHQSHLCGLSCQPILSAAHCHPRCTRRISALPSREGLSLSSHFSSSYSSQTSKNPLCHNAICLHRRRRLGCGQPSIKEARSSNCTSELWRCRARFKRCSSLRFRGPSHSKVCLSDSSHHEACLLIRGSSSRARSKRCMIHHILHTP
mmetsp:Transcript_73433/g.122705  ORF Transcript_73433/g.122705 Transcript_73433/m.122705 type:complete len:250 (-) Transcript_73433:656-1405(-)